MTRATGNNTLKLGGMDLSLRFSVLAMAELEERWGCEDLNGVLARLSGKPSMRDMIDLLFACTRSHHEELTHAECAKVLDDMGIGGTTKALLDTVMIATESADKDGDGQDPGTASGQAG